jgi:hypothetical protein
MSGCLTLMATTKTLPLYNGTITQGNSPGNAVGMSTSFSIGSCSPTTAQGLTIVEWCDVTATTSGLLSISGFGADPGQSFFTSCTAHGTTKTSASVSTYSYSAGRANWSWVPSTFGFATSGTTSGTIT